MATYNDLTPEQKKWYGALYDDLGGDISAGAVIKIHPTASTTTTAAP